MNFEQLLEELNKIVKSLESGELNLEDSLAQYQRGMELSLLCRNKLVEAKEVVLQKMSENQEENS